MSAQHTIHLPDELWRQIQATAEAEGRSAQELTEDALNRYLNRVWLQRIERKGADMRLKYGLKTDDEVEEFVNEAIAEHRRGQ